LNHGEYGEYGEKTKKWRIYSGWHDVPHRGYQLFPVSLMFSVFSVFSVVQELDFVQGGIRK
jgi:hypothetical protein